MTTRLTIKPFRFDIDHGENGEPPPSRQQIHTPQQWMGTAYVWNGGTCELIPIPREGDPDFDEKMQRVAAALRPYGGTSR